MSKRITVPVLGLSLLLLVGMVSRAQEGARDPDSKYAMDLKARKAGEEDFGPTKFGVEVYTDGNTKDAIYLSETGSISVVPAKLFKSADATKAPLWSHGLTLTARKAGDKDWDRGKKFGIEVFRDDTSGGLIYVNENAQVSTVPASYAGDVVAKGKPKNPTWKHAMDLKVRKAGEKDFTKDTKKVGIEVFRDENNNHLVYVSETGSIAVVPAKLTAKDETGKSPDWQHGLELSARKAGEKDFTKDTKRYGLEVFLDQNNGNLIYLCETGAIAVVPAKWVKTTEGKSSAPDHKHAMDLKTRKGGEKDFGKDTKARGVEVYVDTNNRATIYLSDTGELSVVSPSAS